jgi:hypothetical protein
MRASNGRLLASPLVALGLGAVVAFTLLHNGAKKPRVHRWAPTKMVEIVIAQNYIVQHPNRSKMPRKLALQSELVYASALDNISRDAEFKSFLVGK